MTRTQGTLEGSDAGDVGAGATDALIELRRVAKAHVVGTQVIQALRGVDLRIDRGEFVAIMGASGGGKSTLLNILGCLDKPTAGQYLLEGRDVAACGDDELAAIRGGTFGFVFQSFNLLARSSAQRNVELPLIYAGAPVRERVARARAMLEMVGLGDRLDHRPGQLSGGQQQRVAVARALVTGPRVILADEPTGNLDAEATADIIGLLQRLNRTANLTTIMVTHEDDVAAVARRIVRVRDGRVRDDVRQTPCPVYAARALGR